MITIISKEGISDFKFWGDKIIAVTGFGSQEKKILIDGDVLEIGSETIICDDMLFFGRVENSDIYIYIYNLNTLKLQKTIKGIYNVRISNCGFYFTESKDYENFKLYDIRNYTISDFKRPMAYFMYENASIHYTIKENEYTELSELINNWSYRIYKPDMFSKVIGVTSDTIYLQTLNYRLIGLDIKSGDELFNKQLETYLKVDGVRINISTGLENAKIDKLNNKIVSPFLQIDLEGNIMYSYTFESFMPRLKDKSYHFGFDDLASFQFTDEIMVFCINISKYSSGRAKMDGVYIYILNRKNDSLIKKIHLSQKIKLSKIIQIIIHNDAIYARSNSGMLLKIDFDINDYDLSI